MGMSQTLTMQPRDSRLPTPRKEVKNQCTFLKYLLCVNGKKKPIQRRTAEKGRQEQLNFIQEEWLEATRSGW